MKCNVYCTSTKHFAAFNANYARYFPRSAGADLRLHTPEWFARFDVEIDCIAMM